MTLILSTASSAMYLFSAKIKAIGSPTYLTLLIAHGQTSILILRTDNKGLDIFENEFPSITE